MLNDIKAVIFDLDGTLIDSMWMWGQLDKDYLARFDIEQPADLFDEISGMNLKECAKYFKERFLIPDTEEKMMADWNDMAMDFYRNHIQLKDHVRELLVLLRQANISLGIGTSNSRELTHTILKRFGIDEYFQTIRTSADVERGKPNPDIYLKAAKDLDVDPANCLVFEDIPQGLMAANNAGMRSCGIFDEQSKHLIEEILRVSDYYINDFSEIIKIMKDEERHG